METPAVVLDTQQVGNCHPGQHQQRQNQHTVVTQEVTDRNQANRQRRQILPDIVKYLHNLRNNIGHQATHHQDGYDCQHRRIEYGQLDFLPHLLAVLGVVSKPLQDTLQVTGLFTGLDRSAIELWEDMLEITQPCRQGMSFHDTRAYSKEHTLQAWFVCLLGNRTQAFFQRQGRTHQGGQLPGDQCKVGGTDTTLEQGGTLLSLRFALCNLQHIQRHEALLT